MGLGLYAAGGGYENCGESRWDVLGEWVGSENASWVEVIVRLRVERVPVDEFCPPKNEERVERNDMGKESC